MRNISFLIAIMFVTTIFFSCAKEPEGNSKKPEGPSKEDTLASITSIRELSKKINGKGFSNFSFKVSDSGIVTYGYHYQYNHRGSANDNNYDRKLTVDIRNLDSMIIAAKDHVALKCLQGAECVTMLTSGEYSDKITWRDLKKDPNKSITEKTKAMYVRFNYARENEPERFAKAMSHLIKLYGGKTTHAF